MILNLKYRKNYICIVSVSLVKLLRAIGLFLNIPFIFMFCTVQFFFFFCILHLGKFFSSDEISWIIFPYPALGLIWGLAPTSHLLPLRKFCSSYLLSPFFFDPCSPSQLPIVLVQAVVTSHKYYFQIIYSECVSIFSIYIKGW